eukprot:1131885-Pelagomonas_calceolata.AAC.2
MVQLLEGDGGQAGLARVGKKMPREERGGWRCVGVDVGDGAGTGGGLCLSCSVHGVAHGDAEVGRARAAGLVACKKGVRKEAGALGASDGA